MNYDLSFDVGVMKCELNQLILPVADHNVMKNVTGKRMHVEGPQIYQINRQTNSFQIMCAMQKAKIDRLARKIIRRNKNPSK